MWLITAKCSHNRYGYFKVLAVNNISQKIIIHYCILYISTCAHIFRICYTVIIIATIKIRTIFKLYDYITAIFLNEFTFCLEHQVDLIITSTENTYLSQLLRSALLEEVSEWLQNQCLAKSRYVALPWSNSEPTNCQFDTLTTILIGPGQGQLFTNILIIINSADCRAQQYTRS